MSGKNDLFIFFKAALQKVQVMLEMVWQFSLLALYIRAVKVQLLEHSYAKTKDTLFNHFNLFNASAPGWHPVRLQFHFNKIEK